MKYKKQIVFAILTIAGVLTLTPGVYVANAPDLKTHLTAQIPSTSSPFQIRGSNHVRELTAAPYDFVINLPTSSQNQLVTLSTTNGAEIAQFSLALPHQCYGIIGSPRTTATITLLPASQGKCFGQVTILIGNKTTATQNIELSSGNYPKASIAVTTEFSFAIENPIAVKIPNTQYASYPGYGLSVEPLSTGSYRYKASCTLNTNTTNNTTISSSSFTPTDSRQQGESSSTRHAYQFNPPSYYADNTFFDCYGNGSAYINNIWNGLLPHSQWKFIFNPPSTINGVTEPGEECDDQNNNDFDGCSATKLVPLPRPAGCGNSFVESGELCDDGNADEADGCLNSCQWQDPSSAELLSFSFSETEATLNSSQLIFTDQSPYHRTGTYSKGDGTSSPTAFSILPYRSERGSSVLLLQKASDKQAFIDFGNIINFNGPTYTISFFAKPTALGGIVLSKKGSSRSFQGWSVFLSNTELKIKAQSGLFNNGQNETTLKAQGDFTGWKYYTLVIPTSSHDTFRQTKIYLDGAEITVMASDSSDGGFAGNIMPLESRFQIGRISISGQEDYFDGEIDNLHIAQKVLTATEIQNKYAASVPAAVLDTAHRDNLLPSLLTYLPFETGNNSPQIKNFAGEIVGIQRDLKSVRNKQVLIIDTPSGAGTSLQLKKSSSQMLDLGQGFDLDGGIYTVSFWAKFTGADFKNTTKTYTLFSKKNALGYGWSVELNSSGDGVRYTLYLKSTFLTSTNNVKNGTFYLATAPLMDQWAHYTFILDSNTQNAWSSLNGASLLPFNKNSTDAVMKVTPYNPAYSPFVFGARKKNYSDEYVDFLDALIDDLFIFKKALTPDDIMFIRAGKLNPQAADKSKMTTPMSFAQKPSIPDDDPWNTDQ